MVALAVASMSVASYAQTETVEIVEIPTEKYSVQTNKFWNNWFISVGGDYVSQIAQGDKKWANLFFNDDFGQWGFNAAIGKWFTPGLGLRFKFNGLDGKYDGEYRKMRAYRAEAMFNLSNMFCGYSDTRVWNMSFLTGGGFIGGTSAWDFGLQSSWNLGKRVSIFAEAALFFADRHGKIVEVTDTYDKYLDLSVGLTFNLGKTGFKKTPDVDAIMALNASQLDALNAALADQQSENARLKSELAKKPKEVIKNVPVYKASGAPQSVFFNIGSSKLVSKKEIVNLEAIANVAKANDVKVYVTGYADSATGSAAYNQTLSEKRAETVAKELEKLGVSRDKMVIEGKGGVEALKPASYNRRVIVEIK